MFSDQLRINDFPAILPAIFLAIFPPTLSLTLSNDAVWVRFCVCAELHESVVRVFDPRDERSCQTPVYRSASLSKMPADAEREKNRFSFPAEQD